MVDDNAAVRGVAAAFLALSSTAVILRCYVRLRIVKAFGWDDGVMILAMLFYAMFCGCMIGGSLWGTGKHLTELTPKQGEVAMKYWFLCDIAYAVSSVLAKISVCIFLLRVMPFPCHRVALYSVTALAVAAGIVFFVLLVIQCSPVSFWWTRMVGDTDGKCGYIDAIAIMLYIFSVTSALFDLTVGTLPIILVRKLQMSRRTKAAVAGLLGMACIASIAIIIRIPYVQTIRNPDFLYATVEIAIWSAIEIGLSITAGSLATIRPLFRVFFSRPSSRYTPFTYRNTNTNDRSNPNSYSNRQRGVTSHPKSKSHSRRTSDRNGIAAIDSGLSIGLGRTRGSSVSAPTSAPTSASCTSTNIDKERSRERDSRGSPSLNFYEPYIGIQMMTMHPTVEVEGGCSDEFGSAPYPAVGEEVLNMNYDPRLRGDVDIEGGEGEQVSDAQRARSGSRIGVHRTFEVSSSSTIDRDGT